MRKLLAAVSFFSLFLSLIVVAQLANAAPIAHLTLQDPPGRIGMFDITYTPASSQIFVSFVSPFLEPVPAFLFFLLGTPTSGPDNTFAELNFGTNQLGIEIQPGFYPNAERAGFASSGHPGLDIGFQNVGCNTITGAFTIDHATFSNATTLQTFGATFDQLCDNIPPVTFGSFTYDASPSLVTGPETAMLIALAMLLFVVVRPSRHRRAVGKLAEVEEATL